jgi:hypothetical protein
MPGVGEESAFIGGVFRQWFLNWLCHKRLLDPSRVYRLPCQSFNWHPFYFVKYSYCVSSTSYFFTLQSTSAVPSLIIMLRKRQKFWRFLLRDFLHISVEPSLLSHTKFPLNIVSQCSSITNNFTRVFKKKHSSKCACFNTYFDFLKGKWDG